VTTVFDVLDRLAEAESAAAAIEDGTHRLPLSQLRAVVDRLAAGLLARGLRAGDRALIAQGNSIDWIVSALAVMRLGAMAVPINPGATAREAAVYENVVEPRLVLLDADAASPDRFRAASLHPAEASLTEDPAALPARPRAEDRALILFTSGTTGIPKAAVQCHGTLVLSGEGFGHWLQLSRRDRLLLTMPMFHANAIYYTLMGGLCVGAALTILSRFSVTGFWDSVHRAGATEVNLMGPMVAMLLTAPARPDDRENPLRLVYTAAVRPSVMVEFAHRFDVEVVEGYGMTETPYGCITPLGSTRPGSVGLPRRHPTGAVANDVRVVDDAGRERADGEIGEIVIRNNATFLEYWNNPQATSGAFRDGWLRTGDLGRRDSEGYFYIVGRTKEVVRRKGVNIAPAEIEETMGAIEDVAEAALIGVPSPLGEEQAIVVVTLAPGIPRDGAERRIMDRLATLVSREKRPDAVVVTDQLPKTPTHRIERSRLREWLQGREQPRPSGP
jgi:acyl-CoA synthetase (AMP-forming)/AMP-acid ligase II